MHIEPFDIADIRALVPNRLGDERGYFSETFRADIFAQHCGDFAFVQDNESLSAKAGTIRGLHFQSEPHAQGKLVRCTSGRLFDVAVDIRHGSSSFGLWISATLTPENGIQLWIPPGFAHGFCTLTDNTVIAYKVTDYYSPGCDKGLAWNDPMVGIDWPSEANAETLSTKDRSQPLLADLPTYFTWANSSCAR